MTTRPHQVPGCASPSNPVVGFQKAHHVDRDPQVSVAVAAATALHRYARPKVASCTPAPRAPPSTSSSSPSATSVALPLVRRPGPASAVTPMAALRVAEQANGYHPHTARRSPGDGARAVT